MQVAAPFCLLCGCRCDDPQACRVTDAREVHKILRQRCQPTSFHYRAALALPPGDRYPLCMQCVNWTRRAKRSQSLLRGKYLTPLDSIILHALAPGRFSEPDQRCFVRLAAAASDPDNGFASAYPERLRQILAEASQGPGGLESNAVLRSWWLANDSTSFFRHADTARAVRHALVFQDPTQQCVRMRWRRR